MSSKMDIYAPGRAIVRFCDRLPELSQRLIKLGIMFGPLILGIFAGLCVYRVQQDDFRDERQGVAEVIAVSDKPTDPGEPWRNVTFKYTVEGVTSSFTTDALWYEYQTVGQKNVPIAYSQSHPTTDVSLGKPWDPGWQDALMAIFLSVPVTLGVILYMGKSFEEEARRSST